MDERLRAPISIRKATVRQSSIIHTHWPFQISKLPTSHSESWLIFLRRKRVGPQYVTIGNLYTFPAK